MANQSVNENAVEPAKAIKEQVEVCAHCGAENPPGLLLCLECERSPSTGRDLFAPPEILIPDAPSSLSIAPSSFDLRVTLPDPIEVPDPLPISTLEDFIAPPPRPHPVPPPVFRAPPPRPKKFEPLLSPVPRWAVVLLGLGVLAFLGLATAGSIVTLNLPSSICLGSLWSITAFVWLGIVLARRGVSRNQTTGAYRRLVTSMGQRLFEIRPEAAREQRAQLPASRLPALLQPASQLVYLTSAGDRVSQLTQVLLGSLCALVAGEQIEFATQTYQVLTASPFREKVETIRRAVVSERTLYVGAGYLESLIMKQLSRAPANSARELTTGILRQAGADLLNRIAAEASEAPPREGAGDSDLDAQMAALRAYCEEFKTLNPDLYQELAQEVEGAVHEFLRRAGQRAGRPA